MRASRLTPTYGPRGATDGAGVRVSGTHFNEDRFDSCVSGPREGRLRIDLRNMQFMEPYGLVSLASMIDAAADRDVPIEVIRPSQDNQARFLSRMHLAALLDEHGIDHELPTVRENDLAGRLLELERFDQAAVERLAQLVFHKLQESYDAGSVVSDIGEMLIEVCNNAWEHGGTGTGFVSAHVYCVGTPRQVVRFAISDAGQGVRASLAAAGLKPDDDDHALTLAATSEVTSSHQPGRGNGLPDAIDLVTAVRGHAILRSGSAFHQHRGGPPTRRTVVETVGTVVGVTIPCGTPAQRGGQKW